MKEGYEGVSLPNLPNDAFSLRENFFKATNDI